jgi:SAM-dependent methyltransferase
MDVTTRSKPLESGNATPVRAGCASDGASREYLSVNRRGWDRLARLGSASSVPWNVETMTSPKEWLDGLGWLPWTRIRDVLVIGGGGGQQAPLFAWLGHRVTVVDLSPCQLDRDRAVAKRLGLNLECIEGDMCDLSILGHRSYDLVYQPVSSCYVPRIRRCYLEVASVVRPGGLFWSQHWNPMHIQLSRDQTWDGSAYRIDHAAGGSTPRVLTGPGQADGPLCLHYVHRMGDLIGGICDAGFVIEAFAELAHGDPSAPPGTDGHVAAYIPTFYTVLAQRCGKETRWRRTDPSAP